MTPARNPDGNGTVWYREDHCALRWPMVLVGLIAPAVALAAAVLSVVLDAILHSSAIFYAMFAVMAVAMSLWLVRGEFLMYWWPIGIRLSQDGVAIGGVRWAERHPGKRRRGATVLKQGYQVFFCPWDGVTSIWVETRPMWLKFARRNATYGRKPTPLGNLAVPFMTAALIIRVDPASASAPQIHRARNPLAANYSSPGYHQSGWVVPTRHPDRLQQVLASLPLPPGVVVDPATVAQSLQGDPQQQ